MPKTAEIEELVSIADAARLWSVSRDTIERLMGRGELDWIRVGNRRMIPRSALRDYIDRQREHGASS